MTDRPLLTVAHRAGNTLTGLRVALQAGVDLVETDVHLLRDALEVRHTKALARHLLRERWNSQRRHNPARPRLAEVLAAADGDPRLMLDLKGPSLSVATRVAALLRQEAPELPVTVCTKQWRMLDAFDGLPHVRRVLSVNNPVHLGRLRARLRRRPVFGVSIRRQLLTPAIVAELRESATVVMVWPVDTEAALEHARRLGVTSVISKNLPLLRGLLADRPTDAGPDPAPVAGRALPATP
ncbi:glycerophosphodiester phosphodiesterase [Rugosimonospora acidiphila]